MLKYFKDTFLEILVIVRTNYDFEIFLTSHVKIYNRESTY